MYICLKIIESHFSSLKDPRSSRNPRHPFMTLIATSLLAVLCGIDSFSGMQDFVEMHREALKKYFDFPSGVPSHDTYQRLWDNLCPNQFRDCFCDFVESLQKITSDIMNIDGKTIRNSSSNKLFHSVSAWCKNKMGFAQEKVNEKINEIKAIPKLLKLLDLENKIITIDAMGAQRDMCQQIVERKGDYVRQPRNTV
ncbi:putative protein YbfL [Holospora obtusa F1]|uniref:H repeat-associated protein N-terminal domain-containing protein n=1 Tax=Holospora obtusa F1 TaxID=1399147 RepID=W6THF6_HOLOB|nr:ISAs1 family transposase [Holospora obtusa]ETZ07335.1 putative protein YbfL [Holospora obtusa F1]